MSLQTLTTHIGDHAHYEQLSHSGNIQSGREASAIQD
jgi:hypothetical protein